VGQRAQKAASKPLVRRDAAWAAAARVWQLHRTTELRAGASALSEDGGATLANKTLETGETSPLETGTFGNTPRGKGTHRDRV